MPASGVLNLYKPTGPSSARYAYKLRPILGERKIGHAGSLDPFADGVLVVCVGRATRLVERLMGLPKSYETTLQLGVTNAAFDTELPFEPVAGTGDPGGAAIEQVLTTMRGDVMQAPPRFSAVKIAGRASYEFAAAVQRGRRAAEPQHQPTPRPVRIDRLEIVDYAWPRLSLRIVCGRGTYIRAIARDLGQALGCGACCLTLRRTAVGPFRVEQSVRLGAPPEAIQAALRPVEAVLADLAGST